MLRVTDDDAMQLRRLQLARWEGTGRKTSMAELVEEAIALLLDKETHS
jgi:hypothetical protein